MPVYCLDSRDIVELQLKQKDCEILKRKKAALPQPPVAMAPPSVQQGFYQPQLPPASAPAPAAPAAPALPPPAPSKPKSSHPPMKCPMAGTFYRSPTPGAPPFVKVAVVTQMVNVSKSMRCYRKGSNGSALAEFSLFPGDQNDTGDSDGIPVFTFWSIFDFEKLALELVQMFVSEMNIKRLLVMEICSIGSEEFSQVDRLKWSDHFYVGEFEDLLKCNSNSNEVLNQLVPRLESCNSRTFPMQSSNQLESNILQVYLTTWLAEVNVDRFRIGE